MNTFETLGSLLENSDEELERPANEDGHPYLPPPVLTKI